MRVSMCLPANTSFYMPITQQPMMLRTKSKSSDGPNLRQFRDIQSFLSVSTNSTAFHSQIFKDHFASYSANLKESLGTSPRSAVRSVNTLKSPSLHSVLTHGIQTPQSTFETVPRTRPASILSITTPRASCTWSRFSLPNMQDANSTTMFHDKELLLSMNFQRCDITSNFQYTSRCR